MYIVYLLALPQMLTWLCILYSLFVHYTPHLNWTQNPYIRKAMRKKRVMNFARFENIKKLEKGWYSTPWIHNLLNVVYLDGFREDVSPVIAHDYQLRQQSPPSSAKCLRHKTTWVLFSTSGRKWQSSKVVSIRSFCIWWMKKKQRNINSIYF